MNRSIVSTALALLCSAPYAAHAHDDDVVLAAAPMTPATVSAADCARSQRLTRVQRTVVDKATQGVRPLAQYIYRTRMIHQLDVMETVAWLDQRREMQEACAQRVATLGD